MSLGGEGGEDEGGDSPAVTRARARADAATGDERAPALLRLAQALTLDDRLAASEVVAREAAAAFDAQGDGPGTNRAMRVASTALVGLGRADEAADRLDGLRHHLLKHRADPEVIATCDALFAEALRAAGRPVDALGALERAKVVFDDHADEAVLAGLDHDRAVLLAEVGELEVAIGLFVHAREAFLELRDRLGVAACDHNLGFALHDSGNLDDAVEYLQEARGIFLAVGRQEEAAACDQNLGVVLHDMGRLEEAGRRLAVGRHRFAQAGATRSAGECDHNLSVVLVAMGHHDEARVYADRAVAAGVGAPLPLGMSGQVPVVEAPLAPDDPSEPSGSEVEPSESVEPPDVEPPESPDVL
jgi:tetratricopeptide (TPR) repeat protein